MLNKKQIYFRRVVLAAKIASELHEQPTFGHVKFQKLMFLCEHTCKMSLHTDYSKQAAGPYDRKFMHSIDSELKRQKWFDIQRIEDDGGVRYVYVPGVNMPKYEQYYNRYYSDYHQEIHELISTFKSANSAQTELVATLFACWDEMKRNSINFSEEGLIDMFYDWSKEKEKFERTNVKNAIGWMQEKGIFPK